MSWDLLQRFFESDVFNSHPFLPVSYLSRYADHVGIHYVLCNKLRQFPYKDIEFFLPQLCHLVISVNNESMALEGFLLDLCEDSVTAALLTFWLFQTYLHDLSSNPQTDSFQTCRRVYNKVQHIVFGLPDATHPDKISENVLPVTVLASFVLASIGAPFLPRWAGPLAIAQARKPAPPEPVNATAAAVTPPATETDDALPGTAIRPVRARTVSIPSAKSRRGKDDATGGPRPLGSIRQHANVSTETISSPRQAKHKHRANHQEPPPMSRPGSSSSLVALPSPLVDSQNIFRPLPLPTPTHHLDSISTEARLSSASLPLPELRMPHMVTRPPTPVSAGLRPEDSAASSLSRRHSHHVKTRMVSVADLSSENRVRLLRQNYFRCQTQFLRALEDISNRLVAVPKPARLSALRAELALISQDLPAEVDIPIISPPTLVDGSPSRSRHHRIVRLNPAEATVLNSAEKVPYLLMVEILREDFTFDPDSSDNQRLLTSLLSEQGSRKRIFDLSDSVQNSSSSRASDAAAAAAAAAASLEAPVDSVFEPTSGDLGSSPLLKPFDDDENRELHSQGRLPTGVSQRYPVQSAPASRHVSGGASGSLSSVAATTVTTTTGTMTTLSDSTPRSSATSTSRSSSPTPRLRKMTLPISRGQHSADQPDFSALATHMRTASQMLAQLEATSGKRPRHEVAAIRAKIIASMQSLEEQSFDLDDGQGPTFDLIIAKATAAAAVANASASGSVSSSASTSATLVAGSEDADDDTAAAAAAAVAAGGDRSAVNPNAGIARMENDFMTGGLQRKGDRDDPSAAVFGEAWDLKRERIRRSSPYGWMKNWDLVSVIVKTGADLRQEAFACQLITVCDKIWADAGVPVWVKLMRILVTGESSGLIETITNGVSLHSIKRSLTLSSIEAGQNPRRRIATLKDYFAKVFGTDDSETYRAGVDAFKRSLAAYSVISYVLQLKDRHNGNVLVDNEGHIIHIDFGFMLSNSPGSVAFEAAPFKLTHEYVEVLGGLGSPEFDDYKRLCKQAFQALRRSADNIIDLVSMMGLGSKMPCFSAGVVQATSNLRQRFQLHLSAEDAEQFVETELIAKSLGSYYTRLYDTFQYRTQGIY